jgi:hypothetical protein
VSAVSIDFFLFLSLETVSWRQSIVVVIVVGRVVCVGFIVCDNWAAKLGGLFVGTHEARENLVTRRTAQNANVVGWR